MENSPPYLRRKISSFFEVYSKTTIRNNPGRSRKNEIINIQSIMNGHDCLQKPSRQLFSPVAQKEGYREEKSYSRNCILDFKFGESQFVKCVTIINIS